MKLFQGDEHKPLHLEGGEPAALMVHGFPGSPAELRPLATALNLLGWTTHGLLLPGFGAEIETLFERDRQEWMAAIEAALVRLERQHKPVVLIGYSMGAALTINVAASRRPSAIILLAPFWQLGTRWQQAIGLLLRPFFRQLRPFRKADFSDPQVRHGVLNFFPEANLDDPDTQQSMRELTIPTSIFETLYHVGRQAYRSASSIACPTLVLQGKEDQIVPPGRTRKLVRRMSVPINYHEFDAGHDLIDPQHDKWPLLENTIVEFAQSIAQN